jgi:rhodanese-related sulfurtransferase
VAEHSSARAARLLFENGFTQVIVLRGGYAAWKDSGYPVADGKRP